MSCFILLVKLIKIIILLIFERLLTLMTFKSNTCMILILILVYFRRQFSMH